MLKDSIMFINSVLQNSDATYKRNNEMAATAKNIFVT